jgi:hypothetical protein
MSNLDADLAAMDEKLGLLEETPAEETPERPRDEQGRFAPVEETEEPAEATPEEETPAEQLLAGKYKTPEELERAYTELQSLQGRHSQELGELRKAFDELNEKLDSEPEVSMNQPTVDWFDEQLEANPSTAVVWALQNDPSGVLFERGMDAWFEMPGQARQAAAFQAEVSAARVRDELSKQLSSSTGPLMEQADKAQSAEAWIQLRKTVPDLDDHAEQMMAVLEEDAVLKDFLSEKIKSGSVEERTAALRNLYLVTKGHQSLEGASASGAAETAQAEADRAAKLSGQVATQTSTQTAETVDEGEEWLRKNLDPYLGNLYGPE